MAITEQTVRARPYTERRFSVAEYYRMADLGFFEGQQVELVHGEVGIMAPMGPEHITAVLMAHEGLQRAFGPGHVVRIQAPLRVSDDTEPQPDIAVVEGTPRDYRSAHPDRALLVVEVADTSLTYDRTTKASLYAQAGVPDYWVVNLVDRRVEVYRDPAPMPDEPFGSGYRSLRLYLPGEQITPAAATLPVAVDDLLP